MPQTLEHLAGAGGAGRSGGDSGRHQGGPGRARLGRTGGRRGRRAVGAGRAWRSTAPLAVSARSGQGIDELLARLAIRSARTRSPGGGRSLPHAGGSRVLRSGHRHRRHGNRLVGTAGRRGPGAPHAWAEGRPGPLARVPTRVSLQASEPGARTAVGIAGIQRADVQRGDWLVAAGGPWAATSAVDAEISLAPAAARPLTHANAAEAAPRHRRGHGRVMPRSPDRAWGARARAAGPGGARRSRARETASSCAATAPSPPSAAAASWIRCRRDAAASGRRRSPPRAGASGSGPLLERRPQGIPEDQLPVLLGVPAPRRGHDRSHGLRRAEDRRRLGPRRTSSGRSPTAPSPRFERIHRVHPGERGMPLETLRRSLRAPEAVAEHALHTLTTAGRIRAPRGSRSCPASFRGWRAGRRRSTGSCAFWRKPSCTRPASRSSLGRPDGATSGACCGLPPRAAGSRPWSGTGTTPAPRSTGSPRPFRTSGGGRSIAPAALRDRLGISRKFLIPLLEWADAKGITERVGEPPLRLRGARTLTVSSRRPHLPHVHRTPAVRPFSVEVPHRSTFRVKRSAHGPLCVAGVVARDSVGVGSPLAAQANCRPPRVELKENYPNPFFPATTIPFSISQEVCARGHQPVVSLKIYNVLVQVVAIPVLANGESVSGLDSLRLRCGEYRALLGREVSRRKAGSDTGVYYYQLDGGRRAVHPEDDRPEEGRPANHEGGGSCVAPRSVCAVSAALRGMRLAGEVEQSAGRKALTPVALAKRRGHAPALGPLAPLSVTIQRGYR